MEKRLYRNEHNKVIAGVCSGLADYMQIDITMIKVLFILSAIFIPGSSILAYIILWIVIPVNPDPSARFKNFNDYFDKNQSNASMFNSPNAFSNPSNAGEQTKWNTENAAGDFNNPFHTSFNPVNKPNDTSRTISGLILLVVGLYLMLRYTFDVIPEWFSLWHAYKLWPVALVIIGVSLIFRNQRKSEWEKFKKSTEEAQQASANPTRTEGSGVVEENKDSNTPTL